MKRIGIPGRLITMIRNENQEAIAMTKNLYENQEAIVYTDYGNAEWIQVGNAEKEWGRNA